MREIISLQLGNCGNTVAVKFWDTIYQDHGIDTNGHLEGHSGLQVDKINTFLEEGSRGTYIPRSILVNLEPSVAEYLRPSPYGKLFRKENFVAGANGVGNNFAKVIMNQPLSLYM